MQITFKPSLLGFVSRTEAKKQGATDEELSTLDFMKIGKNTYYRQIDLDTLQGVRSKK